MASSNFGAVDALRLHSAEIIRTWQDMLVSSGAAGDARNRGGELRAQADEFMRLLNEAAQGGRLDDIQAESWKPVRSFLTELSTDRARQGYTSTQTAAFVFSLKESIFDVLQREIQDPQ